MSVGGFGPRDIGPGVIYDVDPAFAARTKLAVHTAFQIDPEVLDSTSVDVLVEMIVNDYAASPIDPAYDKTYFDTDDFPIYNGEGVEPTYLPPQVKLTLPCLGATQLLWQYPRMLAGGGGSTGDKGYLVMPYIEPDPSISSDGFRADLAAQRATWFQAVAEAAAAANLEIEAHRAELRAAVRAVVGPNHRRRALMRDAAAELDIPLSASEQQISISLERRSLNLDAIEARAAGNESGLAGEIADALIKQIASFSLALERLPTTANKLAGEDEETLRDVLLFILNANWKGAATGETFIGKGKSDILLRWKDRDAFIGECKFWKGSKAFSDGIDQLLGLYTVWRSTRVAMIVFIRDRKDVTQAIESARLAVKSNFRFIGPSGPEAAETPSYLMRAQADDGQIVTLTLIPVIIPK